MAKKRLPKISIVIPAKDEAENIHILLQRLKKTLRNLKGYKPKDFEIIVICDNCIDNTEKISKSNKVKTIRRTRNPGKSKALIDGFKAAKGQILLMMDADLSHLPEDIPKMVKKLLSKKGVGLVVASRETGGSDDATLVRRIGGKSFNFLTNFFFSTRLTDAINGFKIFHRHIFDNYQYTSSGYAIEIELIANTRRLGLLVEEISSFEPKRAGGVAKSRVIKDGWIFLSELLTEGISYNLKQFRKAISGFL